MKKNLKSAIQYIEELQVEIPNIPPKDAMHHLHCTGYSQEDCIRATATFFTIEAVALCRLAVEEFKHPRIEKTELKNIFIQLGYTENEVNEALESAYPKDIKRYAVKLNADSCIYADTRSEYMLGKDDFTVEAWIKPAKTGGTVISKKSAEGGIGYGGFLLVIKPTGVIKLATDDGYGFFEINSDVVNLFDGNYHHVLGLRKSGLLEIYVDFQKVHATERTNHKPNLDINNHMRLAIGFTDQWQEDFNHYVGGSIGEIRMWSYAKTYQNEEKWKNTDYIEDRCIGMWSFDERTGEDYSSVNNTLLFENTDFVSW